jgi:hypothetical protein
MMWTEIDFPVSYSDCMCAPTIAHALAPLLVAEYQVSDPLNGSATIGDLQFTSETY